MIDIDNLTLGQIKELRKMLGDEKQQQAHPFEIGKNHFVRTVTHHFTGKLVEVYPTELVFVDCAWIADSGRFADAMKNGNMDEVEPYPDGHRVIIGRGALIDCKAVDWNLPRSQK
jgi:hypothetical protein